MDIETIYRTKDQGKGAGPNEFGHALAIGKGPSGTYSIAVIRGEQERPNSAYAVMTRDELVLIRDVLNRELAS